MFEEQISALCFYKYALNLFIEAGHTASAQPIFSNHSIKDILYFDHNRNIAFSNIEREMLNSATNISWLFVVDGESLGVQTNDCIVFYSVILVVSESTRNQVIYDIHQRLHLVFDKPYSIIMFYANDEVMLSLCKSGSSSLTMVLSDWYSLTDNVDILLRKIDIANFSANNIKEYYADFVYALADLHQTHPISADYVKYELIPRDYNKDLYLDGKNDVDKTEVMEKIREIMNPFNRECGTEYVIDNPHNRELSDQMELLGFELELIGDFVFDEKHEDYRSVEQTIDKYEFDNVDPEIFKDAIQLVKLLKKNI